MATSYQDDYMKTALRLPRDLHARIQEAATSAGRSLNAELIARLQDSFSAKTGSTSFVMRLASDRLSARGEALGFRVQVLEAKQQMIRMRMRLLSMEIEREGKAAKTDADFAEVEKKLEEYRVIEREASELALEGDAFLKDRDQHIAEMDGFLTAAEAKRDQMEQAVANYLARKQAEADGGADATSNASVPPVVQAGSTRRVRLTDEALDALRGSSAAPSVPSADDIEAAGRKKRRTTRVPLRLPGEKP
jgi:hypothetical protein